jgi:tRNA nucleotidyltransferase (CCA-adding enzyme)
MADKAPLYMQGRRIPDTVLHISRRLIENGHRAYIVGGALRDSLLDFQIKDWDVATDATPDIIHKLFAEATRFNLKHGTVTLVYKGRHFEVTTFRGKGGFGHSIEEDLAHRDFTFNAMAFDTTQKRIIDPFGGRKDMAEKVVRAVLDPLERFEDDPLRMMRAIRFSLELGYSIDPETLTAINSMAQAIDRVAQERIRDELLRIVMANKPSAGFNLMRKPGLLKTILPELVEGYRKRQNSYHRYTIYRHTMETVDFVEADPVLRLSALFHDIAKPRLRKKANGRWRFLGHAAASAVLTQEIMMRLRFSNDMIARVTNLVAHHMFGYKRELGEKAMRRFVKRVGVDNVENLIKLRKADDLAHGWGRDFEKDIDAFKERIDALMQKSPPLRLSELAVNGRDVMDVLGLQPGPKVGEILKQLLDTVLEKPEYNQKYKLIQVLEEIKEKR